MEWLTEKDGGVEVRVKVVPGATRTRIAGPLGNALKVQVSAPPERGKANAAVARLLAEALGVPAKAVRLTAGATSPRKTFVIDGVDAAEAARRLAGKA